MNKNFFVLVSSLLFGLGLEVSGMTNPQKVQGFLNLFGDWDPSLIFVMVGAIALKGSVYFFLKKKYQKPWFESEFYLPSKSTIDKKLIIGSFIFGLGWAISGFCPGPAVAGVFRLQPEVFVVIASMLTGMVAYKFVE